MAEYNCKRSVLTNTWLPQTCALTYDGVSRRIPSTMMHGLLNVLYVAFNLAVFCWYTSLSTY